ncbi:hypothetical protein Unana1_08320 [Umbelopsis nana]
MSMIIIDYAEVKRVENSPDKQTFLIDVRENDEFQIGHIPSALNIPLATFRETMSLPNEQWVAKWGRDKPALEDRLVIYCRSGRRSNLASLEALDMQYQR